jgi:hypothetical protein
MKIAKLLILVAVHGTVLAGTAQGNTFYTPDGRAIGYTTCSTYGCTYYGADNRIVGVQSFTNPNPAPVVRNNAPAVPPVVKPDLFTNPNPAHDLSMGYRW